MRDMTYDVIVTAVSHPMRMDGHRLRRLYDWTVRSFVTKLGKPPNTFSAKGGGFSGKNYLDYARGHKRLESTDFSTLSRISCALFREKQKSMTIGWDFQARSLEKQVVLSSSDIRWEPTGWWEAALCISPDLLEVTEETCLELAIEFSRRTVEEYGYGFFMHRNRGPMHYVIGMGYEAVQYPNDRTYDESANITGWSTDASRRLTRPWLRDVYPINFLGPRVGMLPIEGTTLTDWLRSDPSRGLSSRSLASTSSTSCFGSHRSSKFRYYASGSTALGFSGTASTTMDLSRRRTRRRKSCERGFMKVAIRS